VPVETLIRRARVKKRSTLYFHYGNIAVLSFTLAMVVLFFYYLFPFQDTLSKAGVAFMAGGLALRILIEIFSTLKSLKIDMSDEALKTTDQTLRFYNFRKKIHGPVTLVIVAFYSAGFYMLMPEFSRHMAGWIIVGLIVAYIVLAVLLIWQIRKGILEEMKNWSEILQLTAELNKPD
jgi:hypothetical protein